MDKIEYSQLAEATLIWTGWGQKSWPCRSDSLVVSYFGSQLAAKLLPQIKNLEEDFYATDARIVPADLQEMEKMAMDQFKKKHPEIPEEIAKAFAWCYTFDFK